MQHCWDLLVLAKKMVMVMVMVKMVMMMVMMVQDL